MIATLLLAAIVAGPTTYRIDPEGAEAGFELKATMHTVHGTTRGVSGEVHCAPGEAGALTLSGSVTVDAASLDTNNKKRDAKMHGASLDVSRFPAITLDPELFTPGAPAGADGTIAGVLTGRLTIRDATHPVSIDATVTPTPTGLDVAGRFDVAWAEFGIPDPSFFVVRIDPVAHAHFRARLVALP